MKVNDRDSMSDIERQVLKRAIEKLNVVYTFGRGESLTSEETAVFEYWKGRGRVRAVGPARFGEIYEVVESG